MSKSEEFLNKKEILNDIEPDSFIICKTDVDDYISQYEFVESEDNSNAIVRHEDIGGFMADCTNYKINNAKYAYFAWKGEDKLPDAKLHKKIEMSVCCEDAIVNQFYSKITGEEVHYGYDLIDQQNWDSLYEAVKCAIAGSEYIINQFKQFGYPEGYVLIKGTGTSEWKAVKYEDYIAFWFEGKNWVSYNRQVKYYPSLDKIDACKTVKEVKAITWGE